jgi:hypothetical protein
MISHRKIEELMILCTVCNQLQALLLASKAERCSDKKDKEGTGQWQEQI